MSDWTIRAAVPEDEACIASMWLRQLCAGQDAKAAGLNGAKGSVKTNFVKYPMCVAEHVDEGIEGSIFEAAHGEYGVDSNEYALFVEGASYGAGWAFAIVGMFTAMRQNPRYIRLDPERVAAEAEIERKLAAGLGRLFDQLTVESRVTR